MIQSKFKNKTKKKKQKGGVVCAGACTAAVATGIAPVIQTVVPVSFGALLVKYKTPKKSKTPKNSKKSKKSKTPRKSKKSKK